MNRRSFLAGLLATTAAVPLAKVSPYAADMGIDLAAGPDTTALVIFEGNPEIAYSWVRRSMGFVVSDFAAQFYPERQDFTRWGPDLVPAGGDMADAIALTLSDVGKARHILDAVPMPEKFWHAGEFSRAHMEEMRLELDTFGYAEIYMQKPVVEDMLPASSEAKHATPKPDRRT